jgi:hypothetical protein
MCARSLFTKRITQQHSGAAWSQPLRTVKRAEQLLLRAEVLYSHPGQRKPVYSCILDDRNP